MAPGELINGYLGRMALLSEFGATYLFLRHLFDVHSLTDVSVHSYIADQLGMDIDALVAEHYAAHYFNLFDHSETADLMRELRAEKFVLRLSDEKKSAIFCRECAETQMAELGFSYWSRDLQLNVYVKCPIHSTTLVTVAEKRPFDVAPSDFLSRWPVMPGIDEDDNWDERYPAITRFASTAVSITRYGVGEIAYSRFSGYVGSLLAPQFNESSEALPEGLMQSYPRGWLYSKFPVLFRRTSRKALSQRKGLEIVQGPLLALLVAISSDEKYSELWRIMDGEIQLRRLLRSSHP
nr:TniQ family protein [Herbaspirillum robiniae]